MMTSTMGGGPLASAVSASGATSNPASNRAVSSHRLRILGIFVLTSMISLLWTKIGKINS
jgi:hypothetical protein